MANFERAGRRLRQPYLWLIGVIGVIVPRRLRSDWRQEWEAELGHREEMLEEWERLDWRSKADLLRRSASAFWDALWLQPRRWEDGMLQDLRYGARMLLKHPGFTFVAVLTLALGIGANTTVFSIVDAWLLRPLPFREPERLIAVWESEAKTPHIPAVFAAYRHYQEWERQSQSLESLAGYFWRDFTPTGADEVGSLMGQIVTLGYFPTLGIVPLHGRTFLPDDLQGPPVVMLGYGFWQRQFGTSTEVIGKTLTLNDKPYTVIGVAPPGHSLPSVAQPDRAEDVWVLLRPDEPLPFERSYRDEPEQGIGVVARLKPGVNRAQAWAELDAIKTRTDERYASSYKRFTTFVANLQQDATRSLRPTLLTITGAAGFVWLIVCANVAGLLLARVAERRKEMAIRNALGAGRGRIVRQTLTESGLLALLGSVCGVLLAQAGVRAFLALRPFEIPAFNEIAINYRALLFTASLSLLTAAVFGVIPAVQAARLNVNKLLNQSGRGSSSSKGTRRARNLLVIAEVALTLMLLAGAGLMTRSLARLMSEPLGYNTDQVLTLDVKLPAKAYPEINQRISFYDQLLARLRALNGVQAVGATTVIPVHTGSGNEFTIEGQPPAEPGKLPSAGGALITEDYFAAAGITLLKGRPFTPSDHAKSDAVAIINETLARQYFPSTDPLGKRIRTGGAASQAPWRTIVGVAGDTKGITYGSLGWRANAKIYEPLRQATDGTWEVNLIIRPSGNAPLSAAMLRDEIQTIDPRLPVAEPRPMSDHVSREIRQPRLQALLSSSFALIALLLAALGLYGVIWYAVIQRTQEIGIRMALGAQVGDVLKLVLGQGMKLTLLGVLLGIGGALAVTRLLQSMLFGVSAADPLTFVGITLLLTLVAALACWLPARRAAKVEPLTALRHD